MKKLVVFLFILSILSCEKQTVLEVHNRAFDGTLYIDNGVFPFKAGQSKAFNLIPGFYEVVLMDTNSLGLSDKVMVIEGYNTHFIKPATRNIHIP